MDTASYSIAKILHISCAVLSIAGFAARGALMLADSRWVRARAVRIVPHVVDTLLLASALWLAWRIGQYPFVHGWLTAKLGALLAYIVLGSVALKRGGTKGVRAAAFVAALAVAAYIFSVALSRDPRGLMLLVAR